MRKSPKVCLVAPPSPSMADPRIAPPLGLTNLIAWCRMKGIEVDHWCIIDHATTCYQPDAPVGHNTHDFSLKRCMEDIPSGADIYGIQLSSMQAPHAYAIVKQLREREPNAVMVCGGSHASALPYEAAELFCYVVEREGEHAFHELVTRWMDNSLPRMPAGEGVVIRGQPVEPLDDLPMPAREFLNFDNYTRKIDGEEATNIITTRGCPARCTFCQQESLWGSGAIRMQHPPRILAEVDHIYETTGIRNLLFLDDSLTARSNRDMRALCEGLKKRKMKWRGWTRANLLARKGQEEILQMMAESGCTAICVGSEAGSTRLLKAMDKGTTVEQNKIAIQRIKDAGIAARTSIMVGNAMETWEDVFALIEYIEEVQPDDWILSSYVPLPGTPSWDDPAKYGFEIDKEEARRTNYAHFYILGGTEQGSYVHSFLDGTGPEEIKLRHSLVQETLLRTSPRDRIRVTIGEVTKQ